MMFSLLVFRLRGSALRCDCIRLDSHHKGNTAVYQTGNVQLIFAYNIINLLWHEMSRNL